MNSNKQCDLYAEFEPEANEILFGQTTLPDRPLTDKEKSKRKKILLKLLDQKLKFELIELMSRQQNQTNAHYAPIPTNQININNSYELDFPNATSPSNYQSTQHAGLKYHPSLEQGNWQTQFQTPWQPSLSYQQYETNRCIPWSNQNYGLQQAWGSPYRRNQKLFVNPNLIEAHTNRVRTSTVSRGNDKGNQSSTKFNSTSKLRHTSTENELNEKTTKPTNKETSSPHSVNQPIQKSSTEGLFTSVIQIDLTKDDESLSPEPKSPDSSKVSSAGPSKLNEKDPSPQELAILTASSDSNEVQQSTDLTLIESIPSTINVQAQFKSNDLAQKQTRKRKQTSSSNENSRKKCITVEQSPKVDTLREIGKSTYSVNITSRCEVESNIIQMDAKIGAICKTKTNNIPGSMTNGKTDCEPNKNATVKASSLATNVKSHSKQPTVRQNAGTIRKKIPLFEGHQICSRNSLTEWNMINQLVTIICRNELHHTEPISRHQLKVKNEIIIQMSINPDAIRSNTIIAQKMRGHKLETFINECKIILSNINRAGPETQSTFAELRDKLIENMKALNTQREITDKAQNLGLVETKIANIIRPFLSSGNIAHRLIAKIIKNPHVLENNNMIKSRMAATNQRFHDVLKNIKGVLDSLIEARSPKQFFLPCNRYVDVPFAVRLYQKTGEMTELYATELQHTLLDSIDSLKMSPKPKIRDVKFSDGSLMMLCVNQKTYEWLQGTISNHLAVEILPIKKVISKSDLKTVCMKFKDPQYLHFNDLMEQLKADNQRLLTRRWELRSPQFVDSTKCIYVGVDAESLVILEEMNYVVKLRGSSVLFVISYDENEKNFERMNVVKQKKNYGPLL